MKIRVSSIAVAAAVAVGAWGCGGETGARGAWSGTIEDSAGVTIVRNGAQGIWAAGEAWPVTEELTIGTTEGDPDYQFGQIAGIAILSDGRLAVLDQQAQHLKLFSPDGTLERTVGSAGAGPGEIGPGAGPVLLGPADTLIVPDVGNQRVNRYAADGSSAGSFAMDFTQGIPLAWADQPSGTIVSQVRPLALPGAPAADSTDLIIVRRTDGTPIDTLLQIPSGRTFSFAEGVEFNFFSPEPLWSVLGDDGIAFGVNDDYRLSVLDEGGQLVRVVTMPFERPLVTEDDERAFVDALERIWTDFGLPPEAVNQLKSGIGFAEYFPAFAQIQRGVEGSLWVQHLVTPSDLSVEERENFNPLLSLGSPRWDVFDPEGRFMGSIEMPSRYQPLRFVGDRIYGIWRDELDVQYVVVLRLGLPDRNIFG